MPAATSMQSWSHLLPCCSHRSTDGATVRLSHTCNKIHASLTTSQARFLNYVQNLYFGFFIFWKLTELCRFVTYLSNEPTSVWIFARLTMGEISQSDKMRIDTLHEHCLWYRRIVSKFSLKHFEHFIVTLLVDLTYVCCFCTSKQKHIRKRCH